jgi:hypothetical protein
MQFYDVKARKKVEVPEGQLKKKTYTRKTVNGTTQTRYAVRANYNGTNLTKFVSKDAYEALNVPVEA